MRKPSLDRVCPTCEKFKKGGEFQYNYSEDCKPCFNAKAKAERNASNVPDLDFQKLGETLFFSV